MVFFFHVVSLLPQFFQLTLVTYSSPVTTRRGLYLGSNCLETFDPL